MKKQTTKTEQELLYSKLCIKCMQNDLLQASYFDTKPDACKYCIHSYDGEYEKEWSYWCHDCRNHGGIEDCFEWRGIDNYLKSSENENTVKH